jgi:hypothetical protein
LVLARLAAASALALLRNRGPGGHGKCEEERSAAFHALAMLPGVAAPRGVAASNFCNNPLPDG